MHAPFLITIASRCRHKRCRRRRLKVPSGMSLTFKKLILLLLLDDLEKSSRRSTCSKLIHTMAGNKERLSSSSSAAVSAAIFINTDPTRLGGSA